MLTQHLQSSQFFVIASDFVLTFFLSAYPTLAEEIYTPYIVNKSAEETRIVYTVYINRCKWKDIYICIIYIIYII